CASGQGLPARTRNRGRVLFDGACFLPLNRLVGVILHFGFVLDDLAVDLVGQQIDGCVEILVDGRAVYVLAAQAHGDLGGMLQTFYREYDLCVYDIVKMPRYPRHFVHYIFPDGGSYFQVTTTDAQVHIELSLQRKTACAEARLGNKGFSL